MKFLLVWILGSSVLDSGLRYDDAASCVASAKNSGIEEIRANFIPTQKNKPAENFLPDFGFKKEGDDWIYKLNNEIKLPNHLKVEIE